MAERQTRDLEVWVRIPVQVQIFLLKFMKKKSYMIYEENFYLSTNLILFTYAGGVTLASDTMNYIYFIYLFIYFFFLPQILHSSLPTYLQSPYTLISQHQHLISTETNIKQNNNFSGSSYCVTSNLSILHTCNTRVQYLLQNGPKYNSILNI